MSPLGVIGMPLDRIPLKLRQVATLEYFDGPLLVLFRDQRGHPYLQSWFAEDDLSERWLLFRVSETDLTRYLLRRRTYREILLSGAAETVYVLDYELTSGAEIGRYLASIDDLPDDLLPNDLSLHEPALRPKKEDQEAPLPSALIRENEWIVRRYPANLLQGAVSHLRREGARRLD